MKSLNMRFWLRSHCVQVERAILGGAALIWIAGFTHDFLASSSTVHSEQYAYFPFFMKPALSWNDVGAKLFDVCALDGCLARFRPWGHLLEWGDAHGTIALARGLGIPFKSVLQYLGSLSAVLGLTFAFRTVFRDCSRAWSFALATFLLCLPSILMLNSLNFRPEKIFCTSAVSWILALWFHCRVGGNVRPKLAVAALALAACGDEVVPLYIALFTAASWIETVWLKTGRDRRFWKIGLPSLVIFAVASRLLGPMAFQAFSTGPILSDYSSPLAFLDLRPRLWASSTLALLGQLSQSFGGGLTGAGMLVALSVAGAIGLSRTKNVDPNPRPDPRLDARLLLFLMVGITLIQDLLVMRHRPLLDPVIQSQGYYYVTPVMALLALAFSALPRGGAAWRSVSIACLLFISFLNFSGMPALRDFALTQGLASATLASRKMESAIGKGQTDPLQVEGLPEKAREYYRVYSSAVFKP